MIEKEIWKVWKDTRFSNIITKSGNYRRNGTGYLWEVSNLGRVKKNGELFDDFECYPKYIAIGGDYLHKAVAELFIPNPENKPQVDHIDTNTRNNRVDNLRWVTPSENLLNPITRNKIKNNRPDFNGKNNPMYGKNVKDYMTDTDIEQWKINLKNSSKHLKPFNAGKHREFRDDGTYYYK